jgi:hypothetical protein
MRPVPAARPLLQRVHSGALFEKSRLVRLRVVMLRPVKALVVVLLGKARELVLASLAKGRLTLTVPQGGFPSVLLALTYRRFVRENRVYGIEP